MYKIYETHSKESTTLKSNTDETETIKNQLTSLTCTS